MRQQMPVLFLVLFPYEHAFWSMTMTGVPPMRAAMIQNPDYDRI